MAWPRIKNSRSSAQPGTQPHDGVQATVTPAPDAEPPPGSGQNAGVSGTTHAVAPRSDDDRPGADAPAADRPRIGWGLRPIRYAHSGAEKPAEPTVPIETADVPPPGAPVPAAEIAETPEAAQEPPGTVLSGTVLSGTVLSGMGRMAEEEPEDYDGTAGLIYEAPRPAYSEPLGEEPPDEPDEHVSNEGLGIFGGVATTEVTDDDAPTRDFERLGRRTQPLEPPAPEPRSPAPTRVIPIGAAWNQPITSPAVTDEPTEERKPNPFDRLRGMLRGGQPAGDEVPRMSVRDLPPDVQLRFLRIRATIAVIVGVVFFFFTRSWEIALTLAILAWIVDTIRRSRTAALHANGATFPGARRATSRQLRRMRRDGYLALDGLAIPNTSDEVADHTNQVIDHLVIGPTGVYAIDSEKWNPRLPIRTWNGKKLYHGPESQKDRLEHAVWEASQAGEILSSALGTEISVRPALAIYGPKIPWDITTIRNVDVFTGSALRKYLKRRGRMREGVVRLTREEIRTIYDTAARTMPEVTAQSSAAATPVG